MNIEPTPRATVLVVEDEELLLECTSRLLETLGYRVLTAADGPHALSLLDQGSDEIDLLLSDVILPGMSGVALATAVQQRFPKVQVLLTSAYQPEVLMAQGHIDSQRSLLKKPFGRRELENHVQSVLIGT